MGVDITAHTRQQPQLNKSYLQLLQTHISTNISTNNAESKSAVLNLNKFITFESGYFHFRNNHRHRHSHCLAIAIGKAIDTATDIGTAIGQNTSECSIYVAVYSE